MKVGSASGLSFAIDRPEAYPTVKTTVHHAKTKIIFWDIQNPAGIAAGRLGSRRWRDRFPVGIRSAHGTARVLAGRRDPA